MNRWWMTAAALAVAAAVTGTCWWLFPRDKGPAAQVRNTSGQTAADPVHEKLFLEEELARKPGHSPVLLRLGQMERESGDLAKARQHLEQAVSGDRKMVDARLELSLVCSQMGDLRAAEEQNRAILRDNPGHPDALYNLGALSANRGDVKAAAEYWREAVAAGPQTPGGIKAAEAQARIGQIASRNVPFNNRPPGIR